VGVSSACHYIGKITAYGQPFQALTVVSSALNGEVFAIGNAGGKILAGGTFTSPGNHIAITDINIGIDEQESQVISSTFYPNPMMDDATLKLLLKDHVRQAELRVYDAQSRLVAEIPADDNGSGNELTFALNREEMRAGLYFYQVYSEKGILHSDKFIVE